MYGVLVKGKKMGLDGIDKVRHPERKLFFLELHRNISLLIGKVAHFSISPGDPNHLYASLFEKYLPAHFAVVFKGRTAIEVGIHFESSNKNQNCTILEYIRKNLSKLVLPSGEVLSFNSPDLPEEWRNIWAKAFLQRDYNKAEEVLDWASRTLLGLYGVATPYLMEAVDEGILQV